MMFAKFRLPGAAVFSSAKQQSLYAHVKCPSASSFHSGFQQLGRHSEVDLPHPNGHRQTRSLHHLVAPPPFPSKIPSGFRRLKKDVTFDPQKHLNYQAPAFVVDMSFKKHQFPIPQTTKDNFEGGLAFTAPFRLLSKEGVRRCREIIDEAKSDPMLIQSDERTPFCLRGLGYASTFIRDLNLDIGVQKLISDLTCGDTVTAHPMPMNFSQINIGQVGLDKPVDKWHIDSVDYVMVVVLSDQTDMEGGELQVIKRPTVEALKLLEERNGNPHPEEVFTVKYPQAGWAILMQGSHILHHVTAVKKAREARISLINSYQSLDVFRKDNTHCDTYYLDPKHVLHVEFARHKAWRVKGMLDYLIRHAEFTESRQQVLEVLKLAENEIRETREVLDGSRSDAIEYRFDETK
ncbi:hypothetical protein HK102_010562 [Quaeritorhiza haematococci]|nr:hypothetical protein HK102_010562 [Quaeritorhiza haematococci]